MREISPNGDRAEAPCPGKPSTSATVLNASMIASFLT